MHIANLYQRPQNQALCCYIILKKLKAKAKSISQLDILQLEFAKILIGSKPCKCSISQTNRAKINGKFLTPVSLSPPFLIQ